MFDPEGIMLQRLRPLRNAPFYSDATVTGDTGLLAAGAAKTIDVVYSDGSQAFCGGWVTIVNNSGQTALINFIVAYSHDGAQTDQSVQGATGNRTTIINGETRQFYIRAMAFVETNAGASAQTGLGVRYFVELEPRRRA